LEKDITGTHHKRTARSGRMRYLANRTDIISLKDINRK
jgi:hypothetical protein